MEDKKMKIFVKKKKKGAFAFSALTSIALTLGIAFIIISIMGYVLTTVQGTQTENATAYNITGKGLVAFLTFGSYFNVLVILGILAILVGILSGFLGGRSE
jgi:hypothetical protein